MHLVMVTRGFEGEDIWNGISGCVWSTRVGICVTERREQMRRQKEGLNRREVVLMIIRNPSPEKEKNGDWSEAKAEQTQTDALLCPWA